MIEIDTKNFDDKAILRRNADGSLPAGDIKAIVWYMVSEGLKPMATNAWPMYEFRNRAGEIVKANLVDIKRNYKEFRKREKQA